MKKEQYENFHLYDDSRWEYKEIDGVSTIFLDGEIDDEGVFVECKGDFWWYQGTDTIDRLIYRGVQIAEGSLREVTDTEWRYVDEDYEQEVVEF